VIERLVTSGTVGLDGGTRSAVDNNNVWLVGDEGEVIVGDAAHDAAAIAAAVAGVPVHLGVWATFWVLVSADAAVALLSVSGFSGGSSSSVTLVTAVRPGLV
jgi:hypothetical protein